MKQITIMQCNICSAKEVMDPVWASLNGQDTKAFICGWCDACDSHITTYVSKEDFDKALETLKRVQKNIGQTEPVQDELDTVIKALEEVAL
jgi:hypothetical protein